MATYNPTNNDIKIDAMTTLHTTAKTNHKKLFDKLAATKEPIKMRI